MPGFTYQATSVKNLNEAAALGGLACLYCCADAFCWFPNTSAPFWKSLLLDDSQSGLGASWSCDGAGINYRPSARGFFFFFFDRDGRKCAKISQLSRSWRVKYACKVQRSLPSGHWEDRAALCNHPSHRLRRATAASLLIAFILHQMSASAAFHIHACFRGSSTNTFWKRWSP